ncbi:MAG: hypothetical protein NC318_07920 [Blautia sp.]|nr:hypothetical protein [Lachnoclostridium sp.]MCM1211516.1 hypothetical protein [Blautia sp.]
MDDGFCYWGIGAYFAGYDWTDLISQSAYYSYGYSIILVPLFWLNRLGVSMTAIYRAAIVLNACFLAGCYLMALYMLKELFEDIPDGIKPVISLFVTLYIGNTAQMGFAWTETFLLFMFWCIIVLLYRVMQRPGYGNILGLAAASAWLVAIHMRAIGVVIAVCMVMVCFFLTHRKEIDKKHIFYTAGVFLAAGCLFIIMKNYVSARIYLGGAENSVNNVSANVERVGGLMNIRGLLDLAVSIIGKIFYIGSATFLLAIVGILAAAVFLFCTLRKQGVDGKRQIWRTKEWMTAFMILSFLAEVGIESLFKCQSFLRTSGAGGADDTLVFGRYADFVIGPMLLFGIWALYHVKAHYKEIIATLLIAAGSAVIVQFFYNVLAFRKKTDTVLFRFAAAPWMATLADGHKTDFACYVMIVSIGILLILCSVRLLSRFRWYGFAAVLLGLTALWSVMGVTGGADYTAAKADKEKSVDTVAEMIGTTGTETPVYMVGQPNTEVKILQWILAGRSIHVCSLEDIDDIDMEQAVILGNSGDIEAMGRLDDRLDFLYDSGNLSVFADLKNTHYEALAAKAEEMAHRTDPLQYGIPLADVATELSYTKMNGGLYYNYQAPDGGYMTWGMGIAPTDGTYEFIIDMRATECATDTEIGYITIGDENGAVQYTQVLYANDFLEKARQDVRVSVEVRDWAEPVIGIYTYGQASMKIFDISYRKTEGCVQLDGEEMADIAAFLEDQDGKRVYYVDSDNSALTGFPWWEYGKLHYLSGQMLAHKADFEDAYYLVEKTDEETLRLCESVMQEVMDTGAYAVFVVSE